MPAGTLYLIPVPIGDDVDPADHLPAETLRVMASLRHFIVESPKSARAVLGRIPMDTPIQQIHFGSIASDTRPDELQTLLAPALAGHPVGVMSESGCPAIADPGARLVARAHALGIPVRPLVGPSSLLLALMASGMNGQRFSFTGYVPVKPEERESALRQLERRSMQHEGESILMIETPYRNQSLLESLVRTLRPETTLVVACELTSAREHIERARISAWRERFASPHPPELPRAPTVFILEALPQGRSGTHAVTPQRRRSPPSRPARN